MWPWSRRDHPKQFLTLMAEQSLLQMAYARLIRVAPPDQIYVIGNAAHAALVRQQLPRLSRRRWIGEPVGRNTAAAIGVGALLIGREDPGAVMVVATADHVIEPASEWVRCIKAASEIALEDVDRLICIGIPPTAPVTGYGYVIPAKERWRFGPRLWAAPAQRYVEKPPVPVARRLIRQGALWNSGMFVWSIPAIARGLQRHLSVIPRALVTHVRADVGTRAFAEQLARAYRTIPSISIDYGVMEHAEDRWLVAAPFRWDDVGSWTSVRNYLPADAAGNAVRGEHLGVGTAQTVILADPGQLIATAGVRNLVIVQHRGVTLIAHRSQAQQIRQLVARCQARRAWRRFL